MGERVTELIFIAQMIKGITSGGGMDGSFKARPYCAGGAGSGDRGTARSQTARTEAGVSPEDVG